MYRLDTKERTIIDGVVIPMLRMLIPSVLLCPNSTSTCSAFRAHLLVEDTIPKIKLEVGRKPEVDIAIQLSNVKEELINLIPLEA